MNLITNSTKFKNYQLVVIFYNTLFIILLELFDQKIIDE